MSDGLRVESLQSNDVDRSRISTRYRAIFSVDKYGIERIAIRTDRGFPGSPDSNTSLAAALSCPRGFFCGG
jgi:hypothetical protein